MENGVVLTYSPATIERVAQILNRISVILKSIYEERAFDEWEKKSIDVPTLIELEVEVKHETDRLFPDYAPFLVATFGLESVSDWRRAIQSCSADHRAIDQHVVPPYGSRLLKALHRASTWAKTLEARPKSDPLDATPPSWRCEPTEYTRLADFIEEFQKEGVISKIVGRAITEFNQISSRHFGSFAHAFEDGRPEVRKDMVKAFYLHLLYASRLRYEYEQAYAERTGDQTIRRPRVIDSDTIGTCLDLTLMFLSCLASVNLWPIYVQVEQADGDHALGGTWITEPASERLKYLQPEQLLDCRNVLVFDCTGFTRGVPGRNGTLSFDEACSQAREAIENGSVRFALDVRRVLEPADW